MLSALLLVALSVVAVLPASVAATTGPVPNPISGLAALDRDIQMDAVRALVAGAEAARTCG
jgi:hypothetical protein